MIIAVIGLNLTLSVVCLWMAWKTWRLRRILSCLEQDISGVEQRLLLILAQTPIALSNFSNRLSLAQQRYRQGRILLTQVQQVVQLVIVAQGLMRQNGLKRKIKVF